MPKLELTIPTEVLSEEAMLVLDAIGWGTEADLRGWVPAAATDGEGLPA
jgi:hypothetical protein